MFTSASLGNYFPKFETRKALIVINLQNDSFDKNNNLIICHPTDFIERIKAMVPFFRRTGDIVWVRTEFELKSATPPSQDEAKPDEVNTQQTAKLTLNDAIEEREPKQQRDFDPVYWKTSGTKAVMRRASAKTRADQRAEQFEEFHKSDDDIDVEAYLSKPRKGQLPSLYCPGTRGAAFTDDILPYVNQAKDSIIVKHHYSALDSTSLLLSLRMNLVTHLYLCGCLSNVSIYATAADAVRHGFEVTVVEDCMGYRSEEKHLHAMRQMADMLGVSGIDSEEIIEEAGGRPPPDAEVPMFSGPGMEGINSQPLATLSTTTPWRSDTPPKPINDSIQNNATTTSKSNVISVDSADEESVQDSSLEDLSSDPQGSGPRRSDKIAAALRQIKAQRPPNSASGPNDTVGEGDSKILIDALSCLRGEELFNKVKEEVAWQTMHHRGGDVPRKVAVQGEISGDMSKPIYRHPADESPPLLPFTPKIENILREVEDLMQQKFNHALIQLYRDGQDNISEHSDKTLDIVRGTNIVNVSLGAQRIMTLRNKRSKDSKATDGYSISREVQRVSMPHNSVFVLGPRTNARWLHGIRADKRLPGEKSHEEKAFGGERISITFRQIGTFIDEEKRKIWGQGAVSKDRTKAGKISTNNSSEMESMILAFGKENQQVDFDWDAEYGKGFNVVNLTSEVA